MSVDVAGKRLSYGVAGAGLIVGFVDAFLPWRSVSIPYGYVCSAIRQCVVETGAFNGSHSAFLYWPGWVFFISVLAGLVLLCLRTFLPHVTISPMPSTDAPVYTIVAAVAVGVGAFWMRAKAHPATRPIGPRPSPASPVAPSP
jgi:hypothetical protein